MSKQWYFAYGSNLDLKRYESRIKRAKDQGIKINYDDGTFLGNAWGDRSYSKPPGTNYDPCCDIEEHNFN